jgi:small subunit ribosomal protein S14e
VTNTTLGPGAREGEHVFGVARILASFNDTFVCVARAAAASLAGGRSVAERRGAQLLGVASPRVGGACVLAHHAGAGCRSRGAPATAGAAACASAGHGAARSRGAARVRAAQPMPAGPWRGAGSRVAHSIGGSALMRRWRAR